MDGWQSNRWQAGEQMKGCGKMGTSVTSRNSDDVWKVFWSGLRNESEGEEEWKWNTAADNSSPPERRVFCQDWMTSGWNLIAVTAALHFVNIHNSVCGTVEVPLKTVCIKLNHHWDKGSDINLHSVHSASYLNVNHTRLYARRQTSPIKTQFQGSRNSISNQTI